MGVRAAVRVPEFRSLLLSYAVNRTGDQLGIFALAIVVFDRTGSALATAVLFLATQFAPGLLGPLVVARIDSNQLGRLLARIYAAETALFAVLAAIAPHGPVAAVVAVAFVDATLAFTARVLTRSGAASTLAERDLIAEGKAAFNMVFAFAMAAGPALAAVLVDAAGAREALALDSASFLVAALIMFSARRRLITGAEAEPDPGSAWNRLRAGFRYLGGHRALRGLVVAQGLALVFFYFPIPIIVVFAKQSLHAGVGGYGAILTSWGVGVIAGSLVQARIARRAGSTSILASSGAVGIGYLGTGAAPTLAVACAASVIGGIGNGTQWAAVETVLHRLVAERFRARVAATLETLAAIAPGVGILAGGALAASWSPRASYYLGGAGVCVLIAVSLLTGRLFAAAPEDTPAPAGAESEAAVLDSTLSALEPAEALSESLDADANATISEHDNGARRFQNAADTPRSSQLS